MLFRSLRKVALELGGKAPNVVFADARLDKAIAGAEPGYFLIPFANHIGNRLVRHGWGAYNGVSMKPCLFAKGAKLWGRQRVHPKIEMTGTRRELTNAMTHYVYKDVADAIHRLNRYSSLNAEQMREDGRVVLVRLHEAPWSYLSRAVLFLAFVIPFVLLISRRTKRTPAALLAVSVLDRKSTRLNSSHRT